MVCERQLNLQASLARNVAQDRRRHADICIKFNRPSKPSSMFHVADYIRIRFSSVGRASTHISTKILFFSSGCSRVHVLLDYLGTYGMSQKVSYIESGLSNTIKL